MNGRLTDFAFGFAVGLTLLAIVGLAGCSSITGGSQRLKIDQTQTYYQGGESTCVEIHVPADGPQGDRP